MSRPRSPPGALTGGLNYYRASGIGPPATNAAGSTPAPAAAAGPSLVVRVPTLVIWGEKDTALLTGNLDGLDEVVPKLTIRRVPDGDALGRAREAGRGEPAHSRVSRAALTCRRPLRDSAPIRSGFLRALKRKQPARIGSTRHRDDLRGVRPPADDRDRRTAVRATFARSRPSSSRAPRCRCIASIAIRVSPRTRRRTRPTSPHVFPTRGLLKHEGAGVYFHVSPDEVWIGGGMYAPEAPQLQSVREHIAANLRKFRAIVESPGFRKHLGTLEGEKLKRVPRGFPADQSGRRAAEVPAVTSPAPSFPASLANEPEVLRHAARRLPRGHAAHALSERAVA